MKVSLIITVLNEEKKIGILLDSIDDQTLKPSEVIIVDGGSSDKTRQIIKQHKKIKLFLKKGNRSVGRNFAIKQAKYNWLAITDAGCILDRNWLKNLVAKQKQSESLVIAGYYKGMAKTKFEEAIIPYVLVMPNKVNPKKFLPATRSLLVHKSVWQKLNGFDEKLSLNEDFAFAKKIKKNNFNIVFCQKAVVYWLPRKNLIEFIKMIYSFAKGDIEAKIIRPKVILIFLRYIIGLGLIVFCAACGSAIKTSLLTAFFIVSYSLWAITKNYCYVKNGWFYLPVLQISSDLAVMWGSLNGTFRS